MVSLKLPDEVFPFYCHECGVKNFRKLLVKLSPHLIKNNTAVGLVSGDVINLEGNSQLSYVLLGTQNEKDIEAINSSKGN